MGRWSWTRWTRTRRSTPPGPSRGSSRGPSTSTRACPSTSGPSPGSSSQPCSASSTTNTELDTEKRLYPGGAFDPLGFADSEQVDRLKEAEIKHARFAVVSMFGMGTQALLFNTGALESLTKFGNLY